MKKRMISLVLAVMLALSVASVAMAGSSIVTAEEVEFGKSYTGTIDADHKNSYFLLDLTDSGHLTVKIMAEVAELKFGLYDENMGVKWSTDQYDDNTTGIISYTYEVDLTADTYYFLLSRHYEKDGTYRVTFDFESAGESFPETGSDGTDGTYSTANKVEMDKEYVGQLARYEQSDFYTFELKESGKLTYHLDGPLSSVNMKIYDSGITQVYSDTYYWNSSIKLLTQDISLWLDPDTYYFAVVKNGDGTTGNYKINLKFEPAATSFPETKEDNNDTQAKADPITLNLKYSGTFTRAAGRSEDSDFYQFTLPVKDTVTVAASASEMPGCYVSITDPDGKAYLNRSEYYNSNTRILSFAESVELEAGTYYLQMKQTGSNYGAYDVAVRAVSGFTDVDMQAYYIPATAWALSKEVTTGTGDGTTFEPFSTVTRGQAVTFLWRAMGSKEPKTTNNPFTDVKSTDFFYKAVLWAVENGITTGTTNTTFEPYRSIDRSSVLTFLYRSQKEPGKTGLGAWYADAERWASENGILDGTGVAYVYNADCPRCDVVYYLYKALNK